MEPENIEKKFKTDGRKVFDNAKYTMDISINGSNREEVCN